MKIQASCRYITNNRSEIVGEMIYRTTIETFEKTMKTD